MKLSPMPGRSLTLALYPEQVISFDVVGPFKQKSIHGNRYGLWFVDHAVHIKFAYPMKQKSDFPKFLSQFLIDFREIFKMVPRFVMLRILRSDSAKEFNTEEVRTTFRTFGIQHQFSTAHQQHQDRTAEKCVGDGTSMMRTIILFSQVARILWEYAMKYVCHISRFLPTSAKVSNADDYRRKTTFIRISSFRLSYACSTIKATIK